MRTRLAFLALLLTLAGPTRAQDGHHFLWEVQGRHNTLYLLGSVHMLKTADSAMPAEILQAYERSRALVMELDLDDPGAESLLSSGLESASLPEGQTLSTVLGPGLYAALLAHAQPLGLDDEGLAHFQPWFAALLLEQLALARAGFEASAGIDMQFAQRARTDHKPITGLETMAEQMGFFAQLSLDQQRQFLRSTLRELDAEGTDTATLVQAWERGDTREFERLVRQESAESPALFRILSTDRNRRWLPKIESLLTEDHDELVIVGAMHLVGDDGLIELLRQRGHSPVQH